MVRFGWVQLDEQDEGTAREERHNPRRDRLAETTAARLCVPSGVSSRSAIHESYPIHTTHSWSAAGCCGICQIKARDFQSARHRSPVDPSLRAPDPSPSVLGDSSANEAP